MGHVCTEQQRFFAVMLPDIALEALRYFDRAALERLQMYSRHLRDLVDRHARSLPLRPIDEIAVSA